MTIKPLVKNLLVFKGILAISFGYLVSPSYSMNLIVNGSFENSLDDWTVSGNVSPFTTSQALDGNSVLVFNGGDTSPTGIISQSLSTITGASYLLEFGYRYFGSNRNQILGFQIDGNGGQGSLLDGNLTVNDSTWLIYNRNFVADSNSVTLRFLDNINNSTGGSDIFVDSVSITETSRPIPEQIPEQSNLIGLLFVGLFSLSSILKNQHQT